MTDFVLYIPSHNDSEAAIESVRSSPDWDIVVVDNGSDKEHASALQSLACPRVEVVRHDQNIGRVENWRYCVEHFADGAASGSWFKMLAAGDRHKPGALDRMRQIVATGPMQLLVTGVEHVGGDDAGIWSGAERPSVYDPVNALCAAAARGNIWHSLSAIAIHCDLLLKSWTFGEGCLGFCADMLFTASLSRHASTYVTPEIVVERVHRHRKTYRAQFETPVAIAEEALVRLRCAEFATDIDGDTDRLAKLTHAITDWTNRKCERLLSTRTRFVHI